MCVLIFHDYGSSKEVILTIADGSSNDRSPWIRRAKVYGFRIT
jgi:hypothetical protein